MKNKFENLKNYLKSLNEQGICLAFSGGIDSTLLLHLCKDFNILALTFESNFQTKEEIDLTVELCKKYNVKQQILKQNVFDNPIILDNPKDRCYHCKKFLFKNALEIAKNNNLKYIIDGTNFDDLGVYRPGRKALRELGIISPLAKFEITKEEIRTYAKSLGIEIFDKPSMPCLATRFPYGTKLTQEKLDLVEKGEEILNNFGFKSSRLRLHGDIARIEVLKKDFDLMMKNKDVIVEKLKNLDIKYVTLDLEGFRSGSMDID